MVRVSVHSSIVLASCVTAAAGTVSVASAAPAKPLVIVFAAPTADNIASMGVRATEQSPDGLLSAQRTQLAARAVRDRFGESNVAEAILYIADSPVFVRAMQEAKLRLKDAAQPSEADRLALGKAIGAVSVVTVRAQSVKDKPGSVEVVLDSTDVESGKTWSDKIAAGGSVLATLPGQISVGDGTAKQTPIDNTAWMTVSNTLVLRYLAGPLGEYTRALPPPGLVNMPKPAPATAPVTLADPAPPAAPITTPAPAATPLPGPTVFPTPPAATSPAPPPTPLVLSSAETKPADTKLAVQNVAAQTARQQADALIASGDVNSAVVVLRKAVNLAPRSLPLRVSLAKAYLSAGRTNDAAAEARRALSVTVPDSDREAWAEMTRVLASASTEIGDNKTARASYEEVLKTQPQAHWARLALGDLFLAQGDTAAAEKEYRTVRQTDPANRDAILSVARVLMARGDFNGAIAEVSTSNNAAGTPQERLAIISVLFDEIAAKTADSVAQNRQAFDGGQLSREAFFKATEAQSARVDSLLTLLRSAAPAAGSAEGVTSVYHRRISAAALLSQAVGSMLTFLESDDKKAGEQAKLLLTEFRKELTAASG